MHLSDWCPNGASKQKTFPKRKKNNGGDPSLLSPVPSLAFEREAKTISRTVGQGRWPNTLLPFLGGHADAIAILMLGQGAFYIHASHSEVMKPLSTAPKLNYGRTTTTCIILLRPVPCSQESKFSSGRPLKLSFSPKRR